VRRSLKRTGLEFTSPAYHQAAEAGRRRACQLIWAPARPFSLHRVV